MGRKLLKTVQTITTFRNPLADPVGTRRGPPLVRGPQFENRWGSVCIECFDNVFATHFFRSVLIGVCLQTSLGFVIFYQVEIDKNVRTQTLFNYGEERYRLCRLINLSNICYSDAYHLVLYLFYALWLSVFCELVERDAAEC